MNPNPYDALIIGAGPAGSLAAFLLARNGWHVGLIEQHSFPRNKVCGECLSALGIETLRRSGLQSLIEGSKPTSLVGAYLYTGDGAHSTLDFENEMWGISRLALDTHLLNAARQSGAEILQPVRAENISLPWPVGRIGSASADAMIRRRKPPFAEAASTNSILIRNLQTNERRTLSTRHILLADGKGALLPSRPLNTTDFGIKAHFENVAGDPRAIALFGYARSYGGVSSIEDDRWNAAFSVSAKSLHQSAGRLDLLFDSIRKENAALDNQFRNARRVGQWCTSPLPRFGVTRDWPAGVIPLGNAAAAVEPIGGEGMGLAMRSAELAVEALLNNPVRPDVRKLRADFNRLWALRPFACRTAALALSSPALGGPIVELLSHHPPLARAALHLMGKRSTGHHWVT